MKTYTYKGETHTLKEWCAILQAPALHDDDLKPFALELEFDGRLSNAALYELYCKHHRPDIKPFKNGNARGWSMGQ